MKVTLKPLINANVTGHRMHELVEKYYLDVAPYASMSFIEFFDFVKSIPYQADPKGMELIKRPYYTINRIGPGGDCDDKAIVLASWAKLNGIPYNFVGVGRKIRGKKYRFGEKISLSHVYSIVKLKGNWIIADVTYSHNVIGRNLGGYDRMEMLGPSNARK